MGCSIGRFWLVTNGERTYAIRPPSAIAGIARSAAAEARDSVVVQRVKRGPLIPGPGADQWAPGDATGRTARLDRREHRETGTRRSCTALLWLRRLLPWQETCGHARPHPTENRRGRNPSSSSRPN